MKYTNRYILLIAAVCTVFHVFAQKLTVTAPNHVAVGEQFRLAYRADSSDASAFTMGNIPSGIEIIHGPSTSTQSSIQLQNGKTTESSSITYTFTMVANRKGTYTFPPAKVTVKGQTVYSDAVTIEISGEARNDDATPNRPTSAAGNTISGNELFVKATLSKNRVYEQEPVVLTYKIYTLVNLTTVDSKTPDIRDCIVNEINLSKQKQFKTEKYNGRNYQTVVWTQYVLYPLRAGEITIPEITYDGTVVQPNRNVDPIDAFFNDSTPYVEMKKQIKAPSVTLHVDSLPKPPMNFSGGVGTFSMSSVMEQTEANAGDTLCLHIKVAGTGNMSLMDAPIVDFPKHFEIVDMEMNDETNIAAEGQKGDIYYDIKFVPLYGGDYEIPAVELTYFNRDTKNYQTIKDKSYLLHVTGNPAPPESDEQASSLLTLLQKPLVLAVVGLIVIVVVLILGIYRNRLKKI